MRKLDKNEAGFSAVEAILILVVLAVIGVAGWLVYKDHHKTTITQTTTKTTSTSSNVSKPLTPDPYSGWQSYSDTYVSFKHPSGWQAGIGQDKYATHDINVTSAGFTSSAISTAINPGAPVTISLQISTSSDIAPSCSDYTCQIIAIVPLSNTQLPNAQFAVVNQTSPNGTNFTQYAVVGTGAKVGDTTITPMKFGSNGIYIYGQPYYTPASGGLSEAARVTDSQALQANSDFKDLVSMINSVKLN